MNKDIEFERWLIEETANLANVVRSMEADREGPTGPQDDVTHWCLMFFTMAEVVSKYTGHGRIEVVDAAHGADALRKLTASGSSPQTGKEGS